jgi:hypothetical protein
VLMDMIQAAKIDIAFVHDVEGARAMSP